jgi:ABC-type glutathione transport system ATPase component
MAGEVTGRRHRGPVAQLAQDAANAVRQPDRGRRDHQALRFPASILPSRREYFTAVDAAKFEIRQGEVFGLVGESGSGKSTIARMIAGLYPVDGGRCRFAGRT